MNWTDRGAWEGSWARLDLARALVRSNLPAEAARTVGPLVPQARDLPSQPLLDEAEQLLRRSTRPGAADEPWRPLTAREFEVARLVAEGLTNAEIADRLGLSPKTAGSHVEHILTKLGAARRAEIAAWAATVIQQRPIDAPAASRGPAN